ncbi:hypothetical protein V2I28_05810 [Campylobacter sp. CX2-4080-23]|uniref:hypothetical protein n=1 Tax=Campylobacter porcelli TaxID=1660073 RepID=UPI002EB331C5|nr:hypothetical protein [Campylobacter sp. CX2-4080-23]
MKVILLNNNPAVSKLISVSLNKLGYEFVEIDNLETLASDNADLIICDSGLYDNQVDYLQYAKNQLFLLPRNRSDEYNLPKEQILQKPFLPTDFIDMINGILKATPMEIKPTKQELSQPNDGIKIGNEFGEIQDIDDMKFDSGDDLSDFADFSDDELLDHDGEIEEKFVENEVKELKDEDLGQATDEISDDISHIDEISDHTGGSIDEFSEISDDEINEVKDKFAQIDDINSNDDIQAIDETKDEFSDIDEVSDNSGDIQVIDEVKDEFAQIDDINSNDDIQAIDEISDHTGGSIDEFSEIDDGISEISDEIKDDKIKEISDDEAINTSEIKDNDDKPSIQDITNEYKNIELDISALDDLPDDEVKSEPAIEVEEVKEPKEIDDLDYTENLDKLSDMLDEIDNMDCKDEGVSQTIENEAKIADLSSSYKANTIDEIDEVAIKAALNEDISQTLEETKLVKSDETTSENENKDELAKVLATQISDEISKALSSSALKDILKDININVNISFKGDK